MPGWGILQDMCDLQDAEKETEVITYEACTCADGYNIHKDGDIMFGAEVVKELTMLRKVVDAIEDAAKHGDGTATVVCTGVGFDKEIEVTDPRQAAREHAEVEMAFANGAEVESVRRYGDYRWTVDSSPKWDWPIFKYRVKPKVPREWWDNIYCNSIRRYDSETEAEDCADDDRIECVHVREILEKS